MASRRDLNATDESTTSAASSVMRHAQLTFQYLAATELETLPHEAVLRRSLTIKSVISTSSSFALRHQRAVSRPDLQHIVQIGEGLQGTIFEQAGQARVMKKEKPGNEIWPSNLRNEYSMQPKVVAAFDRYSESLGCHVRVPRLFDIIPPSEGSFWRDNLSRFPDGYQTRTTVVQMERILPLPKVVRRALVTQFYPSPTMSSVDSATVDQILSDPPNKHCLTRTYLGREDGPLSRGKFSLRNLPLYLRHVDHLGLDTDSLATSMGKAYAIMHWGAGVNGDDVEFVLGTSAIREGEQRLGFQHRTVGLFLLDFGQCEAVDFSADTAVVYHAFKGAMVMGDNQLFIPHYSKSPVLFAAFRKAYVNAAQEILVDKGLGDRFSAEELMNDYEEFAEDFLM